MKVQEIIEKINNHDNLYTIYDAEKEIRKLQGDFKKVATGLNPDKHRCYGVSTSVYKVEDGYVGLTGVSELYFKTFNKGWDTHTIAKEYEEFTTISYRPKD